MIASILVPLDGSTLAERALPYARALARGAKARLHLYHVRSDGPSPVEVRAEMDTEERLEHLARTLREQGVQATAVNAPATPVAESIIGEAGDTPVDLIVMSSHGRGGLGRWLYGSVADQVLSQTNVPVLLVSAACEHSWPMDHPLNILVPLDGSELSEAALGPAHILSQALGARLLLLRVAHHDSDDDWGIDPEHVSMRRVRATEFEAAQNYLQNLAVQPGSSTQPVDILVDAGAPSAVIARTSAREGADLIVMATHGRSGLARPTMGSVATTTLHRAHIPVLFVRPPDLTRPTSEASENAASMTPEAWPPIGTR